MTSFGYTSSGLLNGRLVTRNCLLNTHSELQIAHELHGHGMLYILFIINITYNNKHWTDLRMSQNI